MFSLHFELLFSQPSSSDKIENVESEQMQNETKDSVVQSNHITEVSYIYFQLEPEGIFRNILTK